MRESEDADSWEEASLLTPPKRPEWRLVMLRDRHGRLRRIEAAQVAPAPLPEVQRSSDWLSVIAAVETGY